MFDPNRVRCKPAPSPHPRRFNVDIRNMASRDWRFVEAIDRQAFGATYLDAEQLDELSQARHVQLRVATVDDGTPIAYCVAMLHKGEYEISRIAVLPSLQRRSIGGLLVEDLKCRLHGAKKHRRTRIVAAVLEQDLGTTLFFRECGFRCVGEIGHSMAIAGKLLVMEFNVLAWIKDRRQILLMSSSVPPSPSGP